MHATLQILIKLNVSRETLSNLNKYKELVISENNKINLIKDIKVYFKTKKELDKYCKNEQILHQGFVAEIEKLEDLDLKEFIKKEEKDKFFSGFTIDNDLVSKAEKDAIILHCLPAYRSKEITDEVFESKKNRIFDQAENRLHAQQALLACLL